MSPTHCAGCVTPTVECCVATLPPVGVTVCNGGGGGDGEEEEEDESRSNRQREERGHWRRRKRKRRGDIVSGLKITKGRGGGYIGTLGENSVGTVGPLLSCFVF